MQICFLLSDFYFQLPSQSLFHQFVFIMKCFLDPFNGNVSVCGPWHQTVGLGTENDNIVRPGQPCPSSEQTKLTQRDLKIIISLNGLSGHFNLYFFYWQLRKFMTGWFVQNQWRPQNMTGTIFHHWLPCQFLVKLQKSFGQKCVSNIINLDNGKMEPLWR